MFKQLVLPSIERHILGPNRACDVYAHTYKLDKITNARNGEKAVKVHWEEIFLLAPNATVDTMETFEASLNLSHFRQYHAWRTQGHTVRAER